MERLKTSKKCISLYIILSIVLTLGLVFSYGVIICSETTARIALLWIHGSVVALVLGHLWTVTSLKLIRNYVYAQEVEREEVIDKIYIDPLAVPGWLTGLVERGFFGTLIAFDISATAAGMLTWILVKMATDWHRILGQGQNANSMYGPRSLAYGSLLAGMISLFFALMGGLICRTVLDP